MNDAMGICDWFDKTVPVFQTNINEREPLISPDEDIVNAWNAAGTINQLDFIVEMADGPTISFDLFINYHSQYCK